MLCGSTAERPEVQSIDLGKPGRYMLVGSTYQLRPAVKPESAAGCVLHYASASGSVASVDSSGLITAHSTGTALIIVSADNGIQETVSVHVTESVVELNAVSVPMKPGCTFRISARIHSVTDGMTVRYSSSDESVASVSQKGVITAVSDGTAIITAVTADGASSASITVTVDSAIVEAGIDISRYQGEISVDNWKSVMADGYTFAIIRAGYGREITQMDMYFEDNYTKARQAGMKLGAYHYSYAQTVEQAKAEARVMLKWLEGKHFEYPIAYDIEDSSQLGLGGLTDRIIDAYCSILEKEGYEVMVYSYSRFLQRRVSRSTLANRSVWLAHTRTVNANKVYTGPYDIWQHSHTGRVNGIYGNIDLNVSYVKYG